MKNLEQYLPRFFAFMSGYSACLAVVTLQNKIAFLSSVFMFCVYTFAAWIYNRE
jgi:hypothetical protein